MNFTGQIRVLKRFDMSIPTLKEYSYVERGWGEGVEEQKLGLSEEQGRVNLRRYEETLTLQASALSDIIIVP